MPLPRKPFEFQFTDAATRQPLLNSIIPSRLEEVNHAWDRIGVQAIAGKYNDKDKTWAILVQMGADGFKHVLIVTDADLRVMMSEEVVIANIIKVCQQLYQLWVQQRLLPNPEITDLMNNVTLD